MSRRAFPTLAMAGAIALLLGLLLTPATELQASPAGTAPFGFFKPRPGLVYEAAGSYAVSSGGFNTTTEPFVQGSINESHIPVTVAIDETNNYLYLGDQYSVVRYQLDTGTYAGEIGRVTGSTGTCPASGAAPGWCTGGNFFSGSADGELGNVQAVAVDPARDALYVLDNFHRVAKFVASTGAYVGSIGSTTASTGTCPATGVATTWCTGGTFASSTADGGFATPTALALDLANNFLFVASGSALVKLQASTGAFIGKVGTLTASTGTCPASGPSTGWCTGGTFTAPLTETGIGGVYGIAHDAANDFLYLSATSRVIRIVASSGAFAGGVGRVTASTGTCVVGTNSAWCTGGTFTTGTADGQFTGARGIAFDPGTTSLLVTDNGRIQKIDSATGAFEGAAGGLTASTGSCPASGATTTWCTGGTFATGGTRGYFQSLRALAVNPTEGTYLAADASSYRVVKGSIAGGNQLGALGALRATAGWSSLARIYNNVTADGGFTFSGVMALDSVNDRLYVADQNSGRLMLHVASTGQFLGAIGRLSASSGSCPASGPAPGWCTGGTFTQNTADGGFQTISGITVDPVRDLLYVVDDGNERVMKLVASTGAFIGSIGVTNGASTGTCPSIGAAPGWCTGGTFAGSTYDGAFTNPSGLALDVAANILYLADRGNHRIVRVNAATGAVTGAIGYTASAAGTCLAGVNSSWCTGGTFSASSLDGGFRFPSSVLLDEALGLLYVGDNDGRISKLTTAGAFIGAIGNLTASTGSCPASGPAPGWCTGGTFSPANADGAYPATFYMALDPVAKMIYGASSYHNVTRINATTGAHEGKVGYVTTAGGTCAVRGPAPAWCSGGTISAHYFTPGMFNGPKGVAVDPVTKHVFVMDQSRLQRVR